MKRFLLIAAGATRFLMKSRISSLSVSSLQVLRSTLLAATDSTGMPAASSRRTLK